MAEYSYHLKQNHYVSDLLLVLFNIIPLEEALPQDQSILPGYLMCRGIYVAV